MTQEEKARAYDEALERAKDVYTYYCDDREQLRKIESIFPELRESKDEKIIKAIINHLTIMWGNSQDDICGVNVEDAIAWLEKQSEKPKKVSMWKHWKDGIAGGAEGEQIFLQKIGRSYCISSCLGCECDYIELSELDKLMREQVKSKWSEEDEHHWMMCLECVEECATQERANFSKTIDWLKSIRKAMEEQQ